MKKILSNALRTSFRRAYLGSLTNSVYYPTIYTFLINDEKRKQLKSVLLSAPSPYTKREEHLLFSYQKVVSELPLDAIALLRSFKTNPNIGSALLFKNLPLDDGLPNTPFDGKRVVCKKSFVSEACLTGFSQVLGDVYGYTHEKEGEIIHNICPIKNQEESISNEGSKQQLHFHTENAYFEFRPDYLSFYCLRPDHERNAIFSVIDVSELLRGLSEAEIETLKAPLFRVPTPDLLTKAYRKVLWSGLRPVLSGSLYSPNLLLFLPEMKTNTREANNVYEKIKQNILNSDIKSCGIKLEKGDLVIINNRRAIHGRSAFTPRYDGKDRWLQRVYITNSLLDEYVYHQKDFRVLLDEKETNSLWVEKENREFKLKTHIEIPLKS